MALTHSLTAYRCTFSYLERNNPIGTDEMKDAIKNGEKPEYSLTEFISDYIGVVSSLAIGENSDRAIRLTQITSTTILTDNVTRVHIQPKAGKHGEPITVVERKREHIFDDNAAALYNYNVLFYEKNNEIIAIFYRRGNSGCKTVFFETANKALHHKGIKLEMSLIMPLNQTYSLQSATPSKVGIQWLVPKKKSSDVADELDDMNSSDSKEKKEKWIQKLIIDLKPAQSGWIKNIIDQFTSGKIDKKTAFAEIKTKCVIPNNVENYNDAFIQYQIGGRKTITVRFGEIENQIGAYDITGTLNIANLVSSLLTCADNYFLQVTEGIT